MSTHNIHFHEEIRIIFVRIPIHLVLGYLPYLLLGRLTVSDTEQKKI